MGPKFSRSRSYTVPISIGETVTAVILGAPPFLWLYPIIHLSMICGTLQYIQILVLVICGWCPTCVIRVYAKGRTCQHIPLQISSQQAVLSTCYTVIRRRVRMQVVLLPEM